MIETPQKTYGSFIVPPGKYYLGDPCYLIEDGRLWARWLESCYSDMSANTYDPFRYGLCRELPDTDKKIYAFSTMAGDGRYSDQHGNQYSVDSGIIALVPYDLFSEEKYTPLVNLIEFTDEALCASRDGILAFGPYVIDTALYE